MHLTPEDLEAEFSLPTAATRLDFLSRRDDGATSLDTVVEPAEDDWSSLTASIAGVLMIPSKRGAAPGTAGPA